MLYLPKEHVPIFNPIYFGLGEINAVETLTIGMGMGNGALISTYRFSQFQRQLFTPRFTQPHTQRCRMKRRITIPKTLSSTHGIAIGCNYLNQVSGSHNISCYFNQIQHVILLRYFYVHCTMQENHRKTPFDIDLRINN